MVTWTHMVLLYRESKKIGKLKRIISLLPSLNSLLVERDERPTSKVQGVLSKRIYKSTKNFQGLDCKVISFYGGFCKFYTSVANGECV